MKWILYDLDKEKYVLPICESCLSGKHLSYGDDHRLGDKGRCDCKNMGETESKSVQCLCNNEWSELYDSIEKGIEKVYDTEESAKNAKLEMISEEERK